MTEEMGATERLLAAYRRVDVAKTDQERAAALEALAFATAAPKLPHHLTTAEAWMLAPVLISVFVGFVSLFSADIYRLRDDSPGRVLIEIACAAGAVFVTAAVRQWILNNRGYRHYRKARTGRDTFW